MIEPIRAMLDELDAPALAELDRALGAKLAPTPLSPAERRASRLGHLADVIAQHAPAHQPLIPRQLYDSEAPPHATASASLVEEFGSWLKACRAAHGVKPDGRIDRGPASNSPRTPGHRVRTPTYTREEMTAAIRACALALGRRPTSRAYQRWRRQQIATTRSGGSARPRFPEYSVISRHFGRWRSAVAAAGISDAELAAARSKRAPIAGARALADRRADADARTAEAAGYRLPLHKDGTIDHATIGVLSLEDAVGLARAISCSLAYLIGASGSRGLPPASAVFDADLWKRRLAELRLTENDVVRQIALTRGTYRRAVNGSYSPPVSVVAALAGVIQVQVDALVQSPDDPGACSG